MLPAPFTCTALARGRPIDCINMLAVTGLVGSTILVWLLHDRLLAPIVAAIAVPCRAPACWAPH